MGLDLNNLVTAAGLFAAAVATFRRRQIVERKVDRVHTQMEEVKTQVENGVDEDGRTLHDLVAEIHTQNTEFAKYWEYQRTRNHDIVNLLERIDARQQLYFGLDEPKGTSRESPPAPSSEPTPSPPGQTEDF